MTPPTCGSCGAPDDGQFVHCRYCRQAVSAEALRTAIPCPSCRVACRWGKQKCGACNAWLVVSCVFCGAISPHNLPACLACNEAFAGAPRRKAALEEQRRHRQFVETADVVGHAASPFLGAALGAAVGSLLTSDWSTSSGDDGRSAEWSSGASSDWTTDDATAGASDDPVDDADFGSDFDSGSSDGWDE